MGVIRSDDYHDYVIVRGAFIGEFEQMYQNCEDPWHQDEDGLSEREPLRRLALDEIRRLRPTTILDVGCGLGFFTNQIHLNFPGVDVLGVDVSETAIAKAALRYPQCRFRKSSATELAGLEQQFDLIVASELVWYIVPDLARFFEQVRCVAHEGTHLMLMQFFPDPEEQQYGRDILIGVEGFLKLLPFRVVKSVEVNRLLGCDEREGQGKAGSHRVLILCDPLCAGGRP